MIHARHRSVLHRAHVHVRAATHFHGLAAVVHARVIHAHVLHGQQRARIDRRHRCTQALAHGQGAADVAGAAGILGEDGERILPAGFDDDVEGFRHRDAEFVHADRMHVQAIGGHHGHLQAGNPHVEVGHR